MLGRVSALGKGDSRNRWPVPRYVLRGLPLPCVGRVPRPCVGLWPAPCAAWRRVWFPVAIGLPGGPGAGHEVLEPASRAAIAMQNVGTVLGATLMAFHMEAVKLAIRHDLRFC